MQLTALPTAEFRTLRQAAVPALAARQASPVPANRLDERFQRGGSRGFQANELIFGDGDRRTHLFKVESGAVRLYKILSDGRRQVIGFAYPGEVIGLGAGNEHSCGAEAVCLTRVRCWPVSNLSQAVSEEPALAARLYEAVARELSAAQDMLMTVGRRSAIERVAAFLLSLSERNERLGLPAAEITLPMTRTDIADFLGLTIETVSRTITRLKIKRVITLASATRVRIVDLDALRTLADGSVGE